MPNTKSIEDQKFIENFEAYILEGQIFGFIPDFLEFCYLYLSENCRWVD